MNSFKKYFEYIKDNKEGYWFKRKLYGFGWTPAKWQGWLVLFVWVILFISGMSMVYYDWFKSIIFSISITIILIFICYKKGERPKWQWGKDEE
jgi:hypothetical protein